MDKLKKLRGGKNRKQSSNTTLKKELIQKSSVNKSTPISDNVCEQEICREIIVAHPASNYRVPESSTQAQPNSDSYGLCSCCLELPCPKNMWTEYTWMGHTEIYGNMIMECFGLTYPEDLKPKQQICEVCITRLRDSIRFRRQVASCHARLASLTDTDVTTIKVEISDDDHSQDDNGNITIEVNNSEHQVTALDDNDCDRGSDVGDITINNEDEALVTKKNYKLLKTDARKDRRTRPRTDHIRPRENIGLLLQHTTILPFKSNKGYFNCFYCNKQFVVIEELRKHVYETHQNVTLMSIIKNILRPHDRIKADISKLTCNICDTTLQNMNDTVNHLETHDVKFNYEDKLLKPTECLLAYDLSDGKFTCVVCRSEFHFFKTLTKHMNEHSTNYVCDVCGKCFLLSERLKAHSQVHVLNAAVNCDLCGKLCATVGRLRSHKRHHHKKRSHVCGICNESFPTFRQRMQHLEDVHNRSPLNLNCKICLKTFKTTSHLGCHMRTEHYNMPYIRKRKKKGEEKSDGQKLLL